MRRTIFLAACLLPLSAQAFSARVVKVADGDTITVEHDGERQRVRIFGIDAPEHDQPGGTAAKHDLSALVAGKVVDVEPPAGHARFPHSYDRIVAVVLLPDGQDAGWTMLTLGDAWAYDQYRPPRSYNEAMSQAAKLRVGLWQDASPEAPWDWRRSHHVGHYRSRR